MNEIVHPSSLDAQPIAVGEEPKYESEIRNVLRRAEAGLRQQRDEGGESPHHAAENIYDLVRRAASASTEEVERAILELQNVRQLMRSEEERLGQEIARFLNLNHGAATAMQIVGSSVKKWTDANSPRQIKK